MCCDDGQLLAYLDGEVDEVSRAEIGAHVRTCDECADTLARLVADRAVSASALGRLHATADAAPVAPPERGTQLHAVEPSRPVPGLLARVGWGRIAAAAAAVLVVGSFAFGPVRSAAAGLLGVFRIQKVQTISLSEQDLRRISKSLESGSGHVDLKSLGEVWIEGGGLKPKQVTLDAAKAAVDFPVVLPTGAKGAPSLTLQPAQTYKFKLDVSKVNDVLASYGADTLLPSEADGKVFEVKVPAVLLATYGVAKGAGQSPDGVVVGQARSPELVVPDGVDAARLRDVLVSLPFLPQSVRDQLASVSDWQHTLLIPNVSGSSRDITVNGVPAVVIGSPKDAASGGSPDMMTEDPAAAGTTVGVVWNQDGVVRAVGAGTEESALALAKTMVR